MLAHQVGNYVRLHRPHAHKEEKENDRNGKRVSQIADGNRRILQLAATAAKVAALIGDSFRCVLLCLPRHIAEGVPAALG